MRYGMTGKESETSPRSGSALDDAPLRRCQITFDHTRFIGVVLQHCFNERSPVAFVHMGRLQFGLFPTFLANPAEPVPVAFAGDVDCISNPWTYQVVELLNGPGEPCYDVDSSRAAQRMLCPSDGWNL